MAGVPFLPRVEAAKLDLGTKYLLKPSDPRLGRSRTPRTRESAALRSGRLRADCACGDEEPPPCAGERSVFTGEEAWR